MLKTNTANKRYSIITLQTQNLTARYTTNSVYLQCYIKFISY